MTEKNSSGQSILEATKSCATFSEHGTNAKGAAGFISPYDETQEADFLSKPGQTAIVNPPKDGMHDFEIGVAWDNVNAKGQVKKPKKGLLNKLIKQKTPSIIKSKGVDLDLGCLYELHDGTRGALQAFGNMHGALDKAPFIHLSEDERTGDKEGEDELIKVNGQQWDKFKRIILYIYIYGGADSWSKVQPQVQVRVPSERPMIVTLKAQRQELALCAVARLENIRGGIRMTNLMEYFPGHAEMDRAFSFGLEWDEGQK